MKNDQIHRVCPVERAGMLEHTLRRWIQNPQKILKPYVKEGMTLLDAGCGPGFFAIEMAKMVGVSGRIIAVDLQEGMLKKLRDKIRGTPLEGRISLHKCEENSLGVAANVDFVLAFYMVHEVPNQEKFFRDIGSILTPQGLIFVAEPSFHISKSAFEETVRTAQRVGFIPEGQPKMLLSRTVVLRKAQ